jgi:uncharacterized protein YgbK (DUF1537 family)
LLRGVPLHETEFGSDPRTPVRESDLTRLFGGLGLRLSLVSLEQVRAGEAALAQTLTRLAEGERSVLVFDVSEEEDLARIVRAVKATQLSPLWVGSTGLAGHVGGYYRDALVSAPVDLPENVGTGVIIAGTASEHTRQQFDVLAQRNDVVVIKVDPHALVAAAPVELERCVGLARAALGQGKAAALGVLSSRDEVAEVTRQGVQAGLTADDVARRITDGLGQMARGLVEGAPGLTGLVLTGGDTASAVCAALEAQAIQIIHEVEPGIPLTRLVGPRAVPLIIKAGAFGSPEVLASALKHLTLVERE